MNGVKSGWFFAPNVKEIASLKLNKKAPLLLRRMQSYAEQLRDKNLPSVKRMKLKGLLDVRTKELQKALQDGNVSVSDIKNGCEDLETWDSVSNNVEKISDHLKLDVGEETKDLSPDDAADAAGEASGPLAPNLLPARLLAKAAKAVLNNGKDLTDVLQSWKIARGEDKGVVANMDFIVELPEEVDAKQHDVKCSVRFDANDMKWHAVCLDDRKLQLPEETLVKKALATDEGKQFKKKALETWKKLLDPEDKAGKAFAQVLGDGDELGLELSGDAEKAVALLKKMRDGMDSFEKSFMGESVRKRYDKILAEGKLGDKLKAAKEKAKELKAKAGKKTKELAAKTDKKAREIAGDTVVDKTEAAVSKLFHMAKDAITTYGVNKAGDWLDEIMAGQLKDALLGVYQEKLDEMDDKQLQAELEKLQNGKQFEKAEKNATHQSKKDEDSGTEIDSKSATYQAAWWAKNKALSPAAILNAIVVEVQKKAVKAKEAAAALPAKLKKLGVSLPDDQVQLYGPALANMVEKGASKKEIEDAVKKMQSEVKESLARQWSSSSILALESKQQFRRRQNAKLQALAESGTFMDLAFGDEIRRRVDEGFGASLKALAGKAFSKASSIIPDKAKQKMKDFGSKTVQVLQNNAMAGILAAAGIGLAAFTGGWSMVLCMSAIYAVERHGANLKASFDSMFAKFKNSRGVVARMDFSLADAEDKKYSMRYYVTDQTWRVVNTKDQKKQVKLSRAKAFLNGSEGERFRKRLKEIWDPLFADKKGGDIDFAAIIEQAKGVKVDPKALKLYTDFADNYDAIVSSCCDKLKIDTRAAKLKG